MFAKVTVTDAMAEDMEKLRPRLKKVHIRELVVAITTMPTTHVSMCTCRTKCHCSHAQPRQRPRDGTTVLTVAAAWSQRALGSHHRPRDASYRANTQETLFRLRDLGHKPNANPEPAFSIENSSYFLFFFFLDPTGTKAFRPVPEGQAAAPHSG